MWLVYFTMFAVSNAMPFPHINKHQVNYLILFMEVLNKLMMFFKMLENDVEKINKFEEEQTTERSADSIGRARTLDSLAGLYEGVINFNSKYLYYHIM